MPFSVNKLYIVVTKIPFRVRIYFSIANSLTVGIRIFLQLESLNCREADSSFSIFPYACVSSEDLLNIHNTETFSMMAEKVFPKFCPCLLHFDNFSELSKTCFSLKETCKTVL